MVLRKHAGSIARTAGPYATIVFALLAIILFATVIRASLFTPVEEEKRIWFELSFLLLAAILAELLVVYLKQPNVMLLLLVGVAISPSAVSLVSPIIAGIAGIAANAPHLVSTEGFVKTFAQLGAIFLLFKIGLHSHVKEIINAKNFVVALLGVLVPFAAGYYFAQVTGHGFGYALFLGAALTATSAGVTVAVLEQLGVMKTGFAKIILGAAVIDDVLALLALSLSTSASSESIELLAIAGVVAAATVFVFGGLAVGTWVAANLLKNSQAISNKKFLGILAFVLAYAYVAEFIGLSAIVGAFLAGMCLNSANATKKLFALFYPLEAFFTPIFFISLGMLVDLSALAGNWQAIIAITVIAIVTKLVGCGLGAKAMGESLKNAVTVGVGMVPRGEIALVIALYGLTAKTASGESVLGNSEYAVIASMAFLTTLVTPFLLKTAIGETLERKASF